MTRIRRLTALGLLLLAGGCATQADLARVRRDQQEMRAQMADMQVSVDSVNRRLDTMRTSMDDRGGGANAATVRTLERRIADLEARLSQAPLPTETPVSGAVEPEHPAASLPSTDAAAIALRREAGRNAPINDPYRKALQAYRDGQTEVAIQQFREYVRANPKSDLADNAQYWIGEAYYSKGDYNRSIIELNEVLLKYPQGDQVPGALLALATAFAKSGDPIDAKLILQKLVTDHPKSEEAELGRKQLQSLNE